MNKESFTNLLTADLIYESADTMFDAPASITGRGISSDYLRWQTDKSVYIINQNLFIPSLTFFRLEYDNKKLCVGRTIILL